MLQVVKIAGKDYPVNFGHNALRMFCKAEGITLAEMGETFRKGLEIVYAMSIGYHGLKDGARRAGKDFDMTIEDLGDLFDTDAKAMPMLLNLFNESLTHLYGDSEEEATEKKK